MSEPRQEEAVGPGTQGDASSNPTPTKVKVPPGQQPVPPGRSVPGDSWSLGDSTNVDEPPRHRE